MKFFYDTEFLDNGRTIDLISIGIVAEDGREYYAVNSAVNYRQEEHDLGRRIAEHGFLMEHVVPSLPLATPVTRADRGHGGYLAPELDMHVSCVKPRFVMRNEVRDFLLAGDGPHPKPELWAWYAAYDHVALAQLWGPMISLPAGIPMWTNDLRQEHHRQGSPPLPEQAEGIHNALSDARHNVVRARALGVLP